MSLDVFFCYFWLQSGKDLALGAVGEVSGNRILLKKNRILPFPPKYISPDLCKQSRLGFSRFWFLPFQPQPTLKTKRVEEFSAKKLVSLLSKHLFLPGDLQQGDEDNDQLLPGQPDRGRPHGDCMGSFSQVQNMVDASNFSGLNWVLKSSTTKNRAQIIQRMLQHNAMITSWV